MTRENKLALIIGFTLILMVGVLVSDHLSRARQAQLDAATELTDEPAQRQRAYDGTLLDSAIAAAQDRSSALPAATRVSQVPTPASQLASPYRSSPRTPTGTETARPLDVAPQITDPAPIVIHQGSPLDAITERVPDEQVDSFDLGSASQFFERMRSSATPPAPITTDTPRPKTIAAVPSNDVRVARESRHTVRPGDSLYRIAEQYYGDGNRWRDIQRANADTVDAGGNLKPGQTLTIPGVEPVTIAGPSSSRSATTSGGQSTYTVKPGDTLGEIASDLLGSSKRAGDIVQANRGELSNPNEIRVGMVLNIPSR